MRNGLTASIFAGVAMLGAILGYSSLAQTPVPSGAARVEAISRAADGKPDLSGVWTGSNSVGYAVEAGAEAATRDLATGRVPWFAFSVEEPPMQPWAAERYKANREGPRPLDGGRNATNSTLYPYCLPEGMPRSYTISAFEVVQTPGRVYMLFERNHQVRRIFTDGRKHFENWGPSFLGTSHGRWDGDTLLVETSDILSLDGFARLDTFGHPFTDALHIVERIRRVDHDSLQIDFTFDDPKAYTKPWGGRKIFQLKPDWDLTEDITCEDHLREDFLRDMKSGKPAGRP